MAIKRQMCVNHADRPAIGICMMTKRPICAECSTKYEGVNYSKEGLELLKQQREQKKARKASGKAGPIALSVILFPLLLVAMYFMYRTTFIGLIDFMQAMNQELNL